MAKELSFSQKFYLENAKLIYIYKCLTLLYLQAWHLHKKPPKNLRRISQSATEQSLQKFVPLSTKQLIKITSGHPENAVCILN